MSIFDLIKNKEFDKLNDLIKTNKITNLNIKDDVDEYLIHHIINNNQIELLKTCLLKNINLNILDNNNFNIFYIPLKLNYMEIIELLITTGKNTIGLSIINFKDKNNLTAVNYAIKLNKLEIFKLFIDNRCDLYSTNAIFQIIELNRIDMLKYIIHNNLDIYNDNHESLLQIAFIRQHFDIINLLLNTNKININNQDANYGLTLLHQSIIENNLTLFNKLLELNVDINIQDYYGNTILHYIFIEKHYHFLKILLNKDILYNHYNYNGDIPLHILLNQQYKLSEIKHELIIIIQHSDLNYQNNQGITCLMLLNKFNMLDLCYDILIKKQLNFFLKDNDNNVIKITDNIIDISINSYYNQLIQYKDKLDTWEKQCGNIKLSELTCKNKIKHLIINEKRSIPKFHLMNLILDNGTLMNTCYYTGFPIDILFGLLLLKQDFPDIGLIIDYPLTINKELENYYKKIGNDYPYKLEFCNIEIIWSYQQLFFPSYFDTLFNKKIKEHKYIVIPIGIELSNGAHANILFIDNVNKTIERFEPNGSNTPIGFNYNHNLLDSLLQSKFNSINYNSINYKYLTPSDYLPVIGFQMFENMETKICKKIGDPNGFCGVWSTWWAYQRMLNINNTNINNANVAFELIKYIKFDNIKFKTVIRNFSNKITEIRDKYLDKYKIDINDWVNNNYSHDIIDSLEQDVIKLL
jgi:ankyrin repeat protein